MIYYFLWFIKGNYKLLIGNMVVGQSGGPTSAINATLSGVIQGASKESSTLYGMKNGIEGFLKKDIIDLSYLSNNEELLSLLESTPASALGSCRKKLPSINDSPKIYEDIFKILKEYNIRYFFYIGGNDSMDTVSKISEYSKICDYDIKVIGIPKTIDNDLVITDHTPGYGSAAKYIATVISEIACDTACYLCKAVTIVEIMGRDAGWLTASAGLPKFFGSQGADLIYLPERYFCNEQFISDLKDLLKIKPNIVAAVSEGIRYKNGEYVGKGTQNGVTDAFGHQYLSGAANTLMRLVKNEIGCKVRAVELNLPQRCSSHIASATDILESIAIGKYAVECAKNGISGKTVVFKRKNTDNYQIELVCEDVSKIANKVRYVPKDFINKRGNNVTDKCMEYIAPLIKGERNIKYENGLPVHFKIRG